MNKKKSNNALYLFYILILLPISTGCNKKNINISKSDTLFKLGKIDSPSNISSMISDAPKEFESEIAARKFGVDIIVLKGNNKNNGVLKWFGDQSLYLAIYDQDKTGKFIIKEKFKIPAWHWAANLDYIYLQYCNKQFIQIKFRPWKGTGMHHDFIMLIGWRETKFEIALLETCSFQNSQPFVDESLELQFSFGFQAELKWKYLRESYFNQDFEVKNNPKNYFLIKGEWEDFLMFDENSFSFYDLDNLKKNKEQWGSPIRCLQAKARLEFMQMRPEINSLEKFFSKNNTFSNIPQMVF